MTAFSGAIMVQRLVKKVQRTYFSYQVEQNRHLFQEVNTFVMFIGYPRSGHSLVGSLLDAHPNAVISHELNVLKRLHQGYSQEQLFYLIYQNSRDNARQGREETGYSYHVPGQWQGKYTQLKIIGDKKGGKTAELLAAYPQMLNELFRTIKHPVKFIHVLRNPFDNITSMILRGEDTGFESAIPRYFKMVGSVVAVNKQVGNALIDIYHEDLIQSPRETIIRLCNFLNLPVPDDYVNACASIVHNSPHQTRHKIEWPAEQIDNVRQQIARYDFLQDYSFER